MDLSSMVILFYFNESNASRLAGFHFQQFAGGATAGPGTTIAEYFVALSVAYSVATHPTDLALHDGADPLVGVVVRVKE